MTGAEPAAAHLVVGPPGHGVVRYAELLLAAAGVAEADVLRVPRRVTSDDVPDLLDRLDRLDRRGPSAAAGRRTHLHVTDHLLGRSPEEALAVVTALAARGPVSLTLHDLPQPSDGTPAARRRACYVGLVAVAEGVVVSSDHEAALLAAVTGAGSRTPVRVVPLAVPSAVPSATGESGRTTGTHRRPASSDGSHGARAGAVPGAGARRQVAVLGWVYPGKGHAEVLAALDGLPGDVGLRVLGGASPGHDDLLDELAARAAAAGRWLHVDGWVDDADLPGLLREVDVPVFAPRHVSASASLTAWLSAGRRPVAARSAYTEEVARRSPGTLLVVDDAPAALARGVREALDDPARTWLDPGVAVGLAPERAARLSFAGWSG